MSARAVEELAIDEIAYCEARGCELSQLMDRAWLLELQAYANLLWLELWLRWVTKGESE